MFQITRYWSILMHYLLYWWQGIPGIFHNEGCSLFSWSINRLGRLWDAERQTLAVAAAAAAARSRSWKRPTWPIPRVSRVQRRREKERGCKPPRTRANIQAGGWRKAKGVALTSGWRNAGATPLASSRISALRLTLTLLEHRSVLERGESRGWRGSPRPFHRRCSIGGHRSDLPPRYY